MKKLIAAVLVLALTGCGASTRTDPAEAIRSRLGGEEASFLADISADYIDSREVFSVQCQWDPAGKLTFSVTAPGELSGIRGKVEAPEEKVFFEDTVLALPMLAEGRLSPAAGPYVLMKTLSKGRLISSVREGERLHLTLRESYEDDALEAEVWLAEGIPTAAELSWRGRRQLLLQLREFRFGPSDGV